MELTKKLESAPATYCIISPVKNERRFVEQTLVSVVNQDLKPLRWIIVDDCSSDGTSEILQQYASKYSFIHITRTNHGAPRQPGTGVIRAFNHGLEVLKELDFSFIVKLDCDLEFSPSYFEQLLQQFRAQKNLGIASGVY